MNLPRYRKWRSTLSTACIVVASLGACGERPSTSRLAAYVPVSAAHAQQADTVVPPASMTGAMAAVDEAFALFAASSSIAQVEAARLALKATRSDDVREYAQRLARDHVKAGEDLRRIVNPRGLKLPPAPTGRHADMVTKLSGVAAAEREDAYLRRFGLDAHKEAIALYERHASEGRSPELKRYAQEMLPMLREHIAAARKLTHAAASAR